MSLESYKKSIEAQREREREYSQPQPQQYSQPQQQYSQQQQYPQQQYTQQQYSPQPQYAQQQPFPQQQPYPRPGGPNPYAPKTKQKSGNRHFLWLIAPMILVVILAVAAITNPSKYRTEVLVQEAIAEKVTEKIDEKLDSDEDNDFKHMGSMLDEDFIVTIVDRLTRTEVTNFFFFSTFDCTAKLGGDKKTVAAGVVIFGKVIPLRTELTEDDLPF